MCYSLRGFGPWNSGCTFGNGTGAVCDLRLLVWLSSRPPFLAFLDCDEIDEHAHEEIDYIVDG